MSTYLKCLCDTFCNGSMCNKKILVRRECRCRPDCYRIMPDEEIQIKEKYNRSFIKMIQRIKLLNVRENIID